MTKNKIFNLAVSVAVVAGMFPSTGFAAPQGHLPTLEVVDFIHYRKGSAKANQSARGAAPTVCYGYIGGGKTGAKLPALTDVSVNPNGSGMDNLWVMASTISSAQTWDTSTSANLWGTFSEDAGANFDSVADGVNEISFGPYSDPDVIGVTRVWGFFSGKYKAISQFDMLFNTTYAWGDADLDASLMDYMNIATHELGHALGLGDLYNSCVNETMYGYAAEGETNKRDLNPGDIQGIQKSYGV